MAAAILLIEPSQGELDSFRQVLDDVGQQARTQNGRMVGGERGDDLVADVSDAADDGRPLRLQDPDEGVDHLTVGLLRRKSLRDFAQLERSLDRLLGGEAGWHQGHS